MSISKRLHDLRKIINVYASKIQHISPEVCYWTTLFLPLLIMIEKYIPFNIMAIFMIIYIAFNFIFNWKSSKLIYMSILIIIALAQFVFNYKLNTNYNTIIRVLFTCSMFQIIANEKIIKGFKDFYISNMKLLKIILAICMAVFIITAISGYGFEVWWGNKKYFLATFRSPHICGYFLVPVLALVTIIRIYTGNWFYYIYELIILVLSLMTGARTPLILIFIILLMNMIYDFKYHIKFFKVNSALILVAIFGAIVSGIYKTLPIVGKTIRTTEAGGFTSGRSVFWNYLLIYYKNKFSFYQKLIGSGTDITVFVNKTYYHMDIWAHNDFIQILLSYGIFGLVLFLIIIFQGSKYLNKTVMFGLMFLACFNGLFNYYGVVFMLPLFTTLKMLNMKQKTSYIE